MTQSNIILGRDWFNLCSTGLEDQPDSAIRLLSSSNGFFFIFAVSPFTAVRTQLPSSDSYEKKICLASHSRDIIVGSGACVTGTRKRLWRGIEWVTQ